MICYEGGKLQVCGSGFCGHFSSYYDISVILHQSFPETNLTPLPVRTFEKRCGELTPFTYLVMKMT